LSEKRQVLQNLIVSASWKSNDGISGPSINQLRTELMTVPRQQLLEELWQHFRNKGEWPTTRSFHSPDRKAKVQEAFSVLGSIVREQEDHTSGPRYSLSLLGSVLTKAGDHFRALLKRYFEFQRSCFQTKPDERQFTSEQIQQALGLSKEETELLGQLLWLGFAGGSITKGANIWTTGALTEVEDFPSEGDLGEHVDKWILRHYRPDEPVFLAQLRASSSETGKASATLASALKSEDRTLQGVDVDPLKRRYQVFVSSTYNDLIEERRFMIQALLETKCIPSGMELFPAASVEQWNLIKQVIDDCDYYVLVIAGRYGSLTEAGISYTEEEFDYAILQGKPILAFLYKDIGKLPGDKLEQTDEARGRLNAFVNKVTKNRHVRFWTTPDSLASSIKTAILHEIETNPKPGWVRANSVPSWSMVRSLETRITELESKKSDDSSSQNVINVLAAERFY
jgi:hypothetical protein